MGAVLLFGPVDFLGGWGTGSDWNKANLENFNDPQREKPYHMAYDLDQSSMVCMKFASTLMLAAEQLMRLYQQFSNDEERIPNREASQIMWLNDQFVRVSIKLIESRKGQHSGHYDVVGGQ